MKTLYLFFFIVCHSIMMSAGDSPCSATMIGTNNDVFQTFDNSITTNSGVPPPPYGGYLGPDTWITFTMPSGGLYLIVNGGSMVDPAIALYSGLCSEPKLLYNVLDNNCDGNPNPALFIDELIPGEQYYIRIWAQDGNVNGTFDIKLTQDLTDLPDFIAFGDAIIVNECVELTQNANNQQGCAWYQNAIDFTMPFSHEMTANFGSTEVGADGICLVYQTNGQDYCGGSGGGIGANGMPNSAIFEFDTWSNGFFNDPVDDHCSFNVNGNMDHNGSIDGPIGLGNIEDGLDHTILFEWNPTGNLYALYFDNVLVLNGSYDIINNCFGGNNMAFWGYTSATGGVSNAHVICPIVEPELPSTIEYQEVEVCEGESHMGHTESGFYVDSQPDVNGCQKQINTSLTVYPITEPHYINEVICEGEFILVADENYSVPDEYEIHTVNENGCDSVIFLTLENLVTSVEVEDSAQITCRDTSVLLSSVGISNFPYDAISYTWHGAIDPTEAETLMVTEPGEYSLTGQFTFGDKNCVATTSIVVLIDTISPPLDELSDIHLDCNNVDSITTIDSPLSGEKYTSSWVYQDSSITNIDTLNILGEGQYILTVMDTANGCFVSQSMDVSISDDVPKIDLYAEDLDCQRNFIFPYFTSTGNIESITWEYNDSFFSSDSIPQIDQAGNYSVAITTQEGCNTRASLIVEIDTIHPAPQLEDVIIPCDILNTTLVSAADSNFMHSWSGANVEGSLPELSVSESGWYHLTVTNPTNSCTTKDSSLVFFNGPSPQLDISGGVLNCYNPEIHINSIFDQSNLSFTWESNGVEIGNIDSILVNDEGWYYVRVENANGCDTQDSIYIDSNYTTPEVQLLYDTLNCANETVAITSSILNGDIVYWNGPESFQSDEGNIEVSDSGVYIVSVLNEESGCQITDSVHVIDESVHPEFQMDDDTLTCSKEDLNLPFTIATPYLSLSWTGPNGFSSNDEQPNVTEAGNYHIQVELEGECTLDSTIIISQDTLLPEYTLEYDSITCSNPEVTVTAQIMEGASFQLTTPNGNLVDSLQYVGIESGNYSFKIEGRNGCLLYDTFLVNAYLDLPELAVSEFDSLTCKNPEVDIFVEAFDQILEYHWTGANGFNSNEKDISIIEGGSYNLMATNEYGCTKEIDFVVDAYLDIPMVALEGTDIYCDQLEATIANLNPDENLITAWSGDAGFEDFGDSIRVTNPGWYHLSAESEFGCTGKDSFFVNEYLDPPQIFLLTPDTVVVDFDDPNYQVNIDVVSDVNYEVFWQQESSLSCISCLDPIIQSNDIDALEVEVINEYGCSEIEVIHIRYQKRVKVDIPNVFSPGNNDGANDFFTLYSNDQVAMINSMKIFDRWGELVEVKTNFQPNDPSLGWDGSVFGKLGAEGVYIYIFEVISIDGDVLSYIGDVTLLH